MIRPLVFCILMITGFAGPVQLFVLLGLGYAFWFGGLELIVLCAAIDALFMSAAATVPFYTLGSVAALLLSELVKPYLFVYN